MKYGIDILDNEMVSKIERKMLELGHIVINLGEKNAPIPGENLKIKVMMANQARIKLYLGVIYDNKMNHQVNVVTSFKKSGMLIIENFCDALREQGFEDISIENNDKLYLIKNIKAPVLLIYINDDKVNDKKIIFDGIISGLLSLSV